MSQSNLQTLKTHYEHIPLPEKDYGYETLHGKIVPINQFSKQRPNYHKAPKTLIIINEQGNDFTLKTCIATPTTLTATFVPGHHNKNWQRVTVGGLVAFAGYKFMTTARVLEEFYFEGNHLGVGVINFPLHQETILSVWKLS